MRVLAARACTLYDRCLHVSIVVRIVRRCGIEFEPSSRRRRRCPSATKSNNPQCIAFDHFVSPPFLLLFFARLTAKRNGWGVIPTTSVQPTTNSNRRGGVAVAQEPSGRFLVSMCRKDKLGVSPTPRKWVWAMARHESGCLRWHESGCGMARKWVWARK